MVFTYEAMLPDGSTAIDRVEAGARSEAIESLREKGLLILKIDELDGAAVTRGGGGGWFNQRVTGRDLILFMRQMKMLLESGSPLVPAISAIAEQTSKPALRKTLRKLRERVEGGTSLTDALEAEASWFDPVFRSMIAAGEATATLPEVFGRLAALTHQQLRTRKMVIGAITYPAMLCVLLVGVMAVLLFFVVPRFSMLFDSLNSPLPPTTLMLFGLSKWLQVWWPGVLVGVGVGIVGIALAVRLPSTRMWFDATLLRLPMIGKLARRLIFARVVRVWAAMLRCHVPLLEAIRLSRDAVTNGVFLDLIGAVEERVSSGGRMGEAIAEARVAEPVIVSAIRTGEENGRLIEATDFVSTWLDEDNDSAIQNVTRLAEPTLLAVMGVIVGFVAMALFLPLFDLATAAG